MWPFWRKHLPSKNPPQVQLQREVCTRNCLADQTGAGELFCNACQHTERVLVSTHGFGKSAKFSKGYQCQSCAKFVSFRSDEKSYGTISYTSGGIRDAITDSCTCLCGGAFSRDEPMICPRCKANDVQFQCHAMT